MTQITNVEKKVDEMIERKIASLVWSENASDLNKTLVNGNIRGFRTEIIQALTAEREERARELVSELRKVFMENDGEDSYIQLSARIAGFIRKHETLAPPTK